MVVFDVFRTLLARTSWPHDRRATLELRSADCGKGTVDCVCTLTRRVRTENKSLSRQSVDLVVMRKSTYGTTCTYKQDMGKRFPFIPEPLSMIVLSRLFTAERPSSSERHFETHRQKTRWADDVIKHTINREAAEWYLDQVFFGFGLDTLGIQPSNKCSH